MLPYVDRVPSLGINPPVETVESAKQIASNMGMLLMSKKNSTRIVRPKYTGIISLKVVKRWSCSSFIEFDDL
jgi:hypothetical protein